MNLDLEDTNIGIQPPEFLRHCLNKYNNKSDTQNEKSDKLLPWSHDVWHLGILLVQIINGLPVHLSEKCKVITSSLPKNRVLLVQGLLGFRKYARKDYHNEAHSATKFIEQILEQQTQIYEKMQKKLQLYDEYGMCKD